MLRGAYFRTKFLSYPSVTFLSCSILAVSLMLGSGQLNAQSSPAGVRYLDEVEEDARNQSTLHGDVGVELESLLPEMKAILWCPLCTNRSTISAIP